MQLDKGYRREVLKGRVLLSISLASDEIASLSVPSSLFLLVSRQAYLPAIYAEVHEHFSEHIVNPFSADK